MFVTAHIEQNQLNDNHNDNWDTNLRSESPNLASSPGIPPPSPPPTIVHDESRRKVTGDPATKTRVSMLDAIDPLEDENTVLHQPGLTQDRKFEKLTRLFLRAASNGDAFTLSRMLNNCRKYLDIDAGDEDGTTALIYACCFGHLEATRLLLKSGANPNAKDNYGWTPLVWAANNNHLEIARLLLEYNAYTDIKTVRERTVFNFVHSENRQMLDLLLGRSSDGIKVKKRENSPNSKPEYFLQDEAEQALQLMEESLHLDAELAKLEEEEGIEEFDWDACKAHQMLAFAWENTQDILDVAVSEVSLPLQNRKYRYISANTLYFCARFAHHYGPSELLNELLDSAAERILEVIRASPGNNGLIAYWISNVTLLLLFLKKDHEITVATVSHQLRFCEVITEIYIVFVHHLQHRLDQILEAAMLDHDAIPGLDVKFEGEWRLFNIKRKQDGNKLSAFEQTAANGLKRSNTTTGLSLRRRGPSAAPTTPQSVTALLSSVLYVLRTYCVHPLVVEQVIGQLVHFVACELFNKVLSNRKLICRSKAVQARMNVSVLEEWVRTNGFASSLEHLTPLVQLLQLIQILSQQTDFAQFIDTLKNVNALNPVQLKRCVNSYRYEVDEPKLPPECVAYVQQLAENVFKHRASRRSAEDGDHLNSEQRFAYSSHRGLLTPPFMRDRPCSPSQADAEMAEWRRRSYSEGVQNSEHSEMSMLMEMKDSQMLLPFTLPTTVMLRELGSAAKLEHEDNGGKENGNGEAVNGSHIEDRPYQHILPSVPEEILDLISKRLTRPTQIIGDGISLY
ncbi:uncharacterized protein VTP21DRAFT_1359 [Calcarisporiella thermophila]|uniref:uncharacterized protein n=1 Tax=Calcarisporiella thermophila TaxID=911321 RepID=UPI0037429C60